MAKWRKFVVIVIVVVVVFNPNMWGRNTEPRQMRITFGTQPKTTLSGIITEMERPCERLFRGLLFMLMKKIIIIIIFVVVIIIIFIIIIMLLEAIVSTSFYQIIFILLLNFNFWWQPHHPMHGRPLRLLCSLKMLLKPHQKIQKGDPSPGEEEFTSEGSDLIWSP